MRRRRLSFNAKTSITKRQSRYDAHSMQEAFPRMKMRVKVEREELLLVVDRMKMK